MKLKIILLTLLIGAPAFADDCGRALANLPTDDSARRAVEILNFITRVDGFMVEALADCETIGELLELIFASHAYTIPSRPAPRWSWRQLRSQAWLGRSGIPAAVHQTMYAEVTSAQRSPEDRARYVIRMLHNLETYAHEIPLGKSGNSNYRSVRIRVLAGGPPTPVKFGLYDAFVTKSLEFVGPCLEPLADPAVRGLVRGFLIAHFDELLRAQGESVAIVDGLRDKFSVASYVTAPRPAATHLKTLIAAMGQSYGVTEAEPEVDAGDLDDVRAFLDAPERLAHRDQPHQMSALDIDAEIAEVVSLLNVLQLRAHAVAGSPIEWDAPPPTDPTSLASFHARLRAQGRRARTNLARLDPLVELVAHLAAWTHLEAAALQRLDLRDPARSPAHQRALAATLETLPSLILLAEGARTALDLRVAREHAIANTTLNLELLVARRLQNPAPTTDDELSLALAALAARP